MITVLESAEGRFGGVERLFPLSAQIDERELRRYLGAAIRHNIKHATTQDIYMAIIGHPHGPVKQFDPRETLESEDFCYWPIDVYGRGEVRDVPFSGDLDLIHKVVSLSRRYDLWSMDLKRFDTPSCIKPFGDCNFLVTVNLFYRAHKLLHNVDLSRERTERKYGLEIKVYGERK